MIGIKHKNHKSSGFSLPEVMVAMSIVTMMSFAIYHFSINTAVGLQNSSLVLNANQGVRSYFDHLKEDINHAHYVLMYDAFDGDFRNPEEGVPAKTYQLGNSESGNFLLFVFKGTDENPTDNLPAPIDKIIGYYLDDKGADNPQVMRFEKDLSSEDTNVAIETLIPADTLTEKAKHRVMLKSVTGALDGAMFYRYNNSAFMLSGTTIVGSGQWAHSQTFNSTISSSGL